MTEDETFEATCDLPAPTDTIAQRIEAVTTLLVSTKDFEEDSERFAIVKQVAGAAVSSIEARKAELHGMDGGRAKKAKEPTF